MTIPVDPNSGFFLGHTTTPLPADDALRFHPLPVRFYRFADGLFITAAENPGLRGRRVLRLGTMNADEGTIQIRGMAAKRHKKSQRGVLSKPGVGRVSRSHFFVRFVPLCGHRLLA